MSSPKSKLCTGMLCASSAVSSNQNRSRQSRRVCRRSSVGILLATRMSKLTENGEVAQACVRTSQVCAQYPCATEQISDPINTIRTHSGLPIQTDTMDDDLFGSWGPSAPRALGKARTIDLTSDNDPELWPTNVASGLKRRRPKSYAEQACQSREEEREVVSARALHPPDFAVGTTASDVKVEGGTKLPVADAPITEVLLGYFLTDCVGIQHYRHQPNGTDGFRFHGEMLVLRRDPRNAFDRNAVAVHAMPEGAKGSFKGVDRGGSTNRQRMVGHVPRDTASMLARVADDRQLAIRMIGQVRSGTDQSTVGPHAS